MAEQTRHTTYDVDGRVTEVVSEGDDGTIDWGTVYGYDDACWPRGRVMRVWTDTGALALIFGLVTSAVGCGEAEPVAIERDQDAALAPCSEQAPCEAGQVCVEGACHLLCDDAADESCGTVTLTVTTDGGHVTLNYRIHR